MGQYYMPVIKRGSVLKKVYSHDFENGLKLTEHSYVGNNFVNVVANELVENPAQLYWCGDYAEESDFISKYMFNKVYKYAWRNKERTTVENPNEEFDWTKDWYYINETRKEYILMPKPNNLDWVFTPLSLLTAIGNGRGGGDYHRNNEMVGFWRGDKVYLSLNKPTGKYVDITNDVDFGKDEW